jgi:hypothetical protein
MQKGLGIFFACAILGCSTSSKSDAPGDPTLHCANICAQWQAVNCDEQELSNCEEDCNDAWSTSVGVACASAVNARYECELEQPAESYDCIAGRPSFRGQECSAEEEAARACLVQNGGPHPSCRRVCDLGVVYCAMPSDPQSCKSNCAIIDRLGACATLADAWYDCISGTPLGELSCEGAQLGPSDGSCNDELSALTACVT